MFKAQVQRETAGLQRRLYSQGDEARPSAAHAPRRRERRRDECQRRRFLDERAPISLAPSAVSSRVRPGGALEREEGEPRGRTGSWRRFFFPSASFGGRAGGGGACVRIPGKGVNTRIEFR